MKSTVYQTINNSSISIHPNPTSEYFQVNGIEGTAMVTVSDLNCVVSIKKQITDGESISLSLLRKGVYIAKIITSNYIVEKKLIKI
jgi:hypothetical protein